MWWQGPEPVLVAPIGAVLVFEVHHPKYRKPTIRPLALVAAGSERLRAGSRSRWAESNLPVTRLSAMFSRSHMC